MTIQTIEKDLTRIFTFFFPKYNVRSEIVDLGRNLVAVHIYLHRLDNSGFYHHVRHMFKEGVERESGRENFVKHAIGRLAIDIYDLEVKIH